MNTPSRDRPKDPRVQSLVGQLLLWASWIESGDPHRSGEARAALAELRQATNNPLRAAKHVAPHLAPAGQREPAPDEPIFYALALLFAFHRQHEERVSLGEAFRRIRDDSGSTEKRFLALLASDGEHLLRHHLPHAVRLLASKNQPLDWYRLFDDVLRWDDEDGPQCRRVQRAWANHFYRQTAENDPNQKSDPNQKEVPDDE